MTMLILWGNTYTKTVPSLQKEMCDCGRKIGHFKQVCRSVGSHAVHEVEVESAKDPQGDMETVSINSIFWNNKQSSIMANLKTMASNNTITVPYKIDTSSEGNLIPLYIYKKLFKQVPKQHLQKSIKTSN